MQTIDRPRAKYVDVTQTEGDIGVLARSFRRSLAARNLSAATIRIYSISVAQLADFLAAKGMPLRVASISREHLEEWLTDILRHASAGTAETRYKGVKAFFDWLVEDGELSVSPLAKVRRPQVPETPPDILSDDALKRILKACSGKSFEDRRDLAIFRLLIDTGMRRSECAYLQMEDLDLDLQRVRIGQQAKFSRPRIVPFGVKATAALDRYVRERARHPHASSGALWIGRQGAMGDGALDLMIRRRAKQAGLKVHAHLFRHLFAHTLKVANVQPDEIMALAGWRSHEMLTRYGASAVSERALQTYRRVSPGDRL